MERGRLTKNPSRVPVLLQRQDPVGRLPGPRHAGVVITRAETNTMPTIDKTGTYKNLDGDQFFYTEGTPVTDALHAELELVSAGERQSEGEKRQQEIAEKRAELNAAPENKALGRAPQDRTRTQTSPADGGDVEPKKK